MVSEIVCKCQAKINENHWYFVQNMCYPKSREDEKMEKESNQEAGKEIKRLRYHKKAKTSYEEHHDL